MVFIVNESLGFKGIQDGVDEMASTGVNGGGKGLVVFGIGELAHDLGGVEGFIHDDNCSALVGGFDDNVGMGFEGCEGLAKGGVEVVFGTGMTDEYAGGP